MAQIELRQLVGKHRDRLDVVHTIARNLDQVILNGRQIATISRLPGAPVVLMSHVILSESELVQLSQTIERDRGVPPQKIHQNMPSNYIILERNTEK